MTSAPEGYFRYFAVSSTLERRWGLSVAAAGFAKVGRNSPYPPSQHPAGHHFEWFNGRVLENYQILLVTEGRGWFETKETGVRPIEAGTAFMLFPGVWHRYGPDPEVGWTENWVEMRGPVVDSLRRAHVLTTRACIRRDALAVGMDEAMAMVHARIRAARPGFDPELVARAMSVLAAWDESGRKRSGKSRLAMAVSEAERYFGNHLSEPINMEEVARNLGVAYSHFRRVFKSHTGFAPWQYVVHLRLLRARRMLVESDVSLDDVATRLGFSSAFHLSASFKQEFGVSPDRWRRQMAAQSR